MSFVTRIRRFSLMVGRLMDAAMPARQIDTFGLQLQFLFAEMS